jgi:hypothetical protein
MLFMHITTATSVCAKHKVHTVLLLSHDRSYLLL